MRVQRNEFVIIDANKIEGGTMNPHSEESFIAYSTVHLPVALSRGYQSVKYA